MLTVTCSYGRNRVPVYCSVAGRRRRAQCATGGAHAAAATLRPNRRASSLRAPGQQPRHRHSDTRRLLKGAGVAAAGRGLRTGPTNRPALRLVCKRTATNSPPALPPACGMLGAVLRCSAAPTTKPMTGFHPRPFMAAGRIDCAPVLRAFCVHEEGLCRRQAVHLWRKAAGHCPEAAQHRAARHAAGCRVCRTICDPKW